MNRPLSQQPGIIRESDPLARLDPPGLQIAKSDLFLAALRNLPDEIPISGRGTEPLPVADPTDALKKIFFGGVPIWTLDRQLDEELGTIYTSSPGVFTPPAAMQVLEDYVRTRRFACAVEAGVDELCKRFDSGPIRVLEIGCGPIPFMSIVAALTNPRVEVVALELDRNSAILAARAVEELGLEARVKVLRQNAFKYTPAEPIHLLATETFRTGFRGEPGNDLLERFRAFVVPGGLSIPTECRLEADLVASSEINNAQKYRYLPGGALLFENCFPLIPGVAPTQVWRQRSLDPVKDIQFTLESGDPSKDTVVVRSSFVLYESSCGSRQITLEGDESAITSWYDLDPRTYTQSGAHRTVSFRPGHLLEP